MKSKKKKDLKKIELDEIETLDNDIESKKEKHFSKSILLIISIILLIISAGTFGYLFYQNTKINNDVDNLKSNITKVKEKISNKKQEIDEKESEYEKLKETLKEQFEELSIWEETKENLEKSLS